MESIDYFLSGLSIVLAIFLLVVNRKAFGESRVRIFAYLMAVFLVILADGVLVMLNGFGILVLPFSLTAMLMLSNIAILVLFYYGVVRGS